MQALRKGGACWQGLLISGLIWCCAHPGTACLPGLSVQDWEEGDGDYVAPELLRAGGEPSPASDIFSLGATLYECATGELAGC